MSFDPKDFAGSHCGCRYQQDYRPTLGRDGKKESGTLEVIKFYYDGAIRFEQHCYGEAATFVFGVWADHMDPDGTLHWVLPDRRTSSGWTKPGTSILTAGSFRGSWPTILPRTNAGATPNGRCCWAG